MRTLCSSHVRLRGRHAAKAIICVLAILCLTTSTGCIARMLDFGYYVIKGPPLIPAEYDRLQGKRVAVVCVSAASSFGPNASTGRISRELQRLLAANIKEIEVVREQEVADWLDHHDWTNIDYAAIGRGVEAEQVLVVELNEPLQFREGPSLFRGNADFTVTVLDMEQQGEKVFRRRVEEFRWPSTARYDVPESRFEQAYTRRVADRIGQLFYGVAPNADIGENTSDIGGFE